MADSLNPIDIEQSKTDFESAYTDAFSTKKENASHIGALPMSAVHSLRRHTAELGNAVDNVILELVDKYTAVVHTASTTNATPAVMTNSICDPVDSGTVLFSVDIIGHKLQDDFVTIRLEGRANIALSPDYVLDVKSIRYSWAGGTLSACDADVSVTSNAITIEVTGEAATNIAWTAYSHYRNVEY
jgi:hypothetical protein